jgi:hypothetical protein
MANLNLSSGPVASRCDSLLNVAGAASVAGNIGCFSRSRAAATSMSQSKWPEPDVSWTRQRRGDGAAGRHKPQTEGDRDD